jgi:hypothetical protein
MSNADRNFAFDADITSPLGVRQQIHIRADTVEEWQQRLAEAGGLFPGLISQQAAAAPAAAPAPTAPPRPRVLDNAGNPPCPRHHRPMRDSKYGGWHCTAQEADDSYCTERIRRAS